VPAQAGIKPLACIIRYEYSDIDAQFYNGVSIETAWHISL
jgi:hypothetical protein